jgi:hypothetical protein
MITAPSAAVAHFGVATRKVIVMSVKIELPKGAAVIGEIQEFGSFSYETQRYISRSVHVAVSPASALEWARNDAESEAVIAQVHAYKVLGLIRASLPSDNLCADAGSFLFPLIGVGAFDLGCGCIETFAQYRFLYERLLGAAARQWLPSAFASAVALTDLDSSDRRSLLASLRADLDSTWSRLEPSFFPELLEE